MCVCVRVFGERDKTLVFGILIPLFSLFPPASETEIGGEVRSAGGNQSVEVAGGNVAAKRDNFAAVKMKG